MGREATCQLQWGQDSGACKVLLESNELIVRGPIKRRVPISSLKAVATKGEVLTFRVGEELVKLSLGSDAASKWEKAIATPPPTLARKLGITSESRLRVIGEADDRALASAIADAGSVNGSHADLILLCVNSQPELAAALPHLDGLPVWVIYPKGPGRAISEASVRETLRGIGYMDTKVASVSTTLTALRFQRSRM